MTKLQNSAGAADAIGENPELLFENL